MWDFLGAGYHANLVQGSNFRAQSAMDTEHFSIHNGCKRKEIKDLTTGFPDRSIAVLCLALLVKAVDLGNLSGLVISTDKCNAVWEPDDRSVLQGYTIALPRRVHILCLQAHEECEGFKTKVSSIYKVAKEDEVLLAIATHDVLGGTGLRSRPRTASTMNASAPAPLFLVVVIASFVFAVAFGWAGWAGIIGVALEPALHLAFDLGVRDTRGGLNVGGIDGAGDDDW